MYKIIVASTSAVKIAAVEEAASQLGYRADIIGVKAPSGVDEQPLGYEVTLKGATNRINNAYTQNPEGVVYVAIENGVMREGNAFIDRAIVVVRIGDKLHPFLSEGVKFPAVYVAASVASNLTVTVGKLMAEAGVIDQHDDPHKDLPLVEHPRIKKPRAQILEETLIKAFRACIPTL